MPRIVSVATTLLIGSLCLTPTIQAQVRVTPEKSKGDRSSTNLGWGFPRHSVI